MFFFKSWTRSSLFFSSKSAPTLVYLSRLLSSKEIFSNASVGSATILFLQYSWSELVRPWPTWPGNILLPLASLLVLALLRILLET